MQEAQHLLGQLFGAACTALGREATPGAAGVASRAAEVDAGGLFLVLAIWGFPEMYHQIIHFRLGFSPITERMLFDAFWKGRPPRTMGSNFGQSRFPPGRFG